MILHILPNAHLDPVWLWDWKEGLNEGITTVSTVLDLMDENPDLTFIRGEAVIYQHIQRTAPKVFRRMRERIEEGRWDVVGGTWVQPDSNLSSTETLCRHFETSLAYFQKQLGVRPRISWQADSFGHPAGWPNILQAFGMEGFVFTRPQRWVFPMDSPVFWWEGDHKNQLLCYRQHQNAYCSERTNILEVLDQTHAAAAALTWENVGVLMGLGNHGGGPTRRHLLEIEQWKKQHPDVVVRYSTFQTFFEALRSELATSPEPPVHHGDLGYCLRGCYSSVQKFKSLYRQAEALVRSAETAQTIIGGQLSQLETPLGSAWESILFNSFHDILPGTSIERAMEEQSAWVGMAIHQSHQARFEALNVLASRVDTRVPAPLTDDSPTEVPLLIWNGLPRAFSGAVELEASLDYRPLFAYENACNDVPFALCDENGTQISFQEIATEHSSMPNLPWRKRVVAHLDIPSFGWRVVRLGLSKEKYQPEINETSCRETRGTSSSIENARWTVAVENGRIAIKLEGENFFSPEQHLKVQIMEDIWGSWGGMSEEPESFQLDKCLEEWSISESAILESGPERVRLWTRWQGTKSWLDLTFDLCRNVPWIMVHGRMLWNERSARLQLILPSAGPALCDIPGSTVTRTERGQVPVGRWFTRVNDLGMAVGVASDVLSDADFLPEETRITLARASRYANDVPTRAEEKRWQPAVDCGELKFQMGLFSDGVRPDHVVDSLLSPPVAMPVPPSPGDLLPQGSFGELMPDSVNLLSASLIGGGLQLRVQNRGSQAVAAAFEFAGKTHSLGSLKPQQILTSPALALD